MDAVDEQILRELKRNGRASAASIARSVSLSVPAVLDRMGKLTRAGILEGYSARISRAKTDRGLLAFVFVRLSGTAHIAGFRERVVAMSDVLECHHLAGQYDYLLKVAVAEPEKLERFLTEQLKPIDGVAETNTLIALATLKEEWNG